ncbi:MAG: hypothetical protein H3C38_02415 [Rhodospirillales bacterium]|nr:hypothetical protein [Rhodospirillales bacterium]
MNAGRSRARPRWLVVCGGGVDAGGLIALLAGYATRRLGGSAIERLDLPEIELRFVHDSGASDPTRSARTAVRRGVDGVFVVLRPSDAPSGEPAAALLGVLSRRRPGLPVVLLLMDEAGAGAGALFTGSGASVEAAVSDLVERASRAALDDAARAGFRAGQGMLVLPANLAGRAPAWRSAAEGVLGDAPTARLGGLSVIGNDAPAESWMSVFRSIPVGRSRPGRALGTAAWGIAATAAAVVVVGVALATLRDIGEVERRVERHAQIMRLGDGSETLSMGSLGSLAALMETAEAGSARLPLVPASWSGGVEALIDRNAPDQMVRLLIEPVRRRLEREATLVEEDLARFADSPPGLPEQERTRAAMAARALADLDGRVRRFRIEAEGAPREQWENLATWVAEAPVFLPWLDTERGGASFRAGMQRAAPLPRRPFALVDRFLAVLETRGAMLSSDRALFDAVGAADALMRKAAGGDVETTVALRDALATIVAEGERLGEEPSAGDEALAILRAAGLITETQWRDAVAAQQDAHRARLTRRLDQDLAGIGPLFERSGERSGRAVASRQLRIVFDALDAIAEGGFAGTPALPRPDLADLAMREGGPDARLVDGAARRLRAFGAWRDRYGEIMFRPAFAPIGASLAAHVAASAIRELAAAYRSPSGVDWGLHEGTVEDLVSVMEGLAAIDTEGFAEAAWLVGVRAYRQLERLDAAYERLDLFRLSGMVATWSGEGAVLRGAGWQSDAARRRWIGEALDRLRGHVRQAAPLLRVLTIPAVAESLKHPRLIRKWTVLDETVAQPETAVGYQALRAYALDVLPAFRRADCQRPERFPAFAGQPADPFADELASLAGVLAARCALLSKS